MRLTDAELNAIFSRSGWIVKDSRAYDKHILSLLRAVAESQLSKSTTVVQPHQESALDDSH